MKTLQGRVVPISKRLFDVLMALPDAPRTTPVFRLKKWQNSWDATCEAARIEGIRWRDLRATFITRLVEAGVPVELVAKISGHADVATLYAHYLCSSASAIDAARDALDSVKR